MEPFVGQLMCVAFNFAPRGWALCQGQLMAIQSNTALFSLLGTMYGGDGRTTFGLPDLRGRIPLSFGQAKGLQDYVQGETAGVETVTLVSGEIPAHTHTVMGSGFEQESQSPQGMVYAQRTAAFAESPDALMSAAMVGPNTGGVPHDNHQPYVVINWIISLEGSFPPRS